MATACSQGPAAPSQVVSNSRSIPAAFSPTAGTAQATKGVINLTDNGPPPSYHLVVVTSVGRVVRSATARVPSVGGHLPRFSVAGRSVYFIDGDTHLKALRPDGSVASLAELPGGPADRVVFAISPDERQLAFSVLHYATPTSTTTSLRVGSLDLHDAHQIFAGSIVEFPIGWHDGNLVISVEHAGFVQNLGEVNPYFAVAYHMADASTANCLFSTSPMCDEPSSLQGPVNSAGTVCEKGSGNTRIFLALGWDGSSRELFRANVDGFANAFPPVVLSPDGQRAAGTTEGHHLINIFSGGTATSLAATGTPGGWFDANQLFYMEGDSGTQAMVLDIAASNAVAITLGVSGSTDSFAPFFVPIPSNLT